MKSKWIASIAAVIGMLAAGGAVGFAQQNTTSPADTQNTTSLQSTMGNMMTMQHEMMSTSDQDNAELNQLLAKVEAAKGNAQTAAIVDLLKAMIADQRQIHHQQMQMQGQMMNGMDMMSHMMGMMGGRMMNGRNGGPTR